MKRLLVLLAVLPMWLSAQTLPKECFGVYAGEMPSYTVVVNDIEMNIEAHLVEVRVSGESIAYTSGGLVLKGPYAFVKQSGSEYLIKASLSNGKSVNYQLDLLWNRKKQTLSIAGKNGEPDVVLEKRDA